MVPIRPAKLASLAAASILAATALAGCAKDADLYPSLSIRDAERVSGTFEPVEPETYTPPPPTQETLGRIASLRADATRANQRFLSAAERARRPIAAARGTAVGSESWAVAQTALADVSSARSETMIALAELDGIHAATSNEGGDLAEIEAARAEVEAVIESQDRLIAQMGGEIPG